MAGSHFKKPDDVSPMIPARETTSRGTHERKTEQKKGKMSISRILSNLLIVVGIVLLLVAGGMWGMAQFRYKQQEKVNTEQQKHVMIKEPEEVTPENKCPIEVDWEGLKAVNDDIVGWIYVPGTVINYPVYQGEDNDRYLRNSATGEWSVGGQVFLDYENTAPGLVDNQSILYGHHLQDGTMFQPMTLLDNQDVFDSTDTIWYVTERTAYELEPLFMYYTQPTDVDGVRQFRFINDTEFRKYLTSLLERAVTQRPDAAQIIANTRHVLTMSTCNYYDGYGRSLLVSVPKAEARGESIDAPEMPRPTETPAPEENPEENNAEEGEETYEEYPEEVYDETTEEVYDETTDEGYEETYEETYTEEYTEG